MKRKKRRKGGRVTPFVDKAGLSPGTPVFIGERKQTHSRVDVLQFSATDFRELDDSPYSACKPAPDAAEVTWVNVTGIHDVNVVADISGRFGIHPLTQEDIVNTAQRPKTEAFDNYLFLVLKMLTYNADQNEVEIETVSIVLGDRFVLSFQEREGDAFDPVRERLRTGKGRIRRMGADYLAYSLMDAIVDAYFVALEQIGDHIEMIEDEIVADPRPAHMQELHRLKREVLYLRKSVWPLREEVSVLTKRESAFIREDTALYLRDLYDHIIRVIDMVETNRDILSSLHDTYLSSASNRMNEVMKMLTIIATIFIPLTFIVGVYGMNFEYMPELKWRWGYFGIWGLMVSVTAGMLVYFRRKGWLG